MTIDEKRQQLEDLVQLHRSDIEAAVRNLSDILNVSNSLRDVLLRALPLLPYVATTVVAFKLLSLLRGRRVPAALVIAGLCVDIARVVALNHSRPSLN